MRLARPPVPAALDRYGRHRMNRITVILLAALDAVIALGVGVAIPLVPLTVAWGMTFGSSAGWLPYWRSGVDVWLLGHGVDVTVTLDPVASAMFGLSGTNVFTVTIAALGFALLTVVFGFRTGRRAWATPHAVTAAVSGVAVFAVLSALVTLSAHTGPAVPSLLQGTLLPALVFAIGIGIGVASAQLRDGVDPARVEHPRAARPPWPVATWSEPTRAVLSAALRGGVAASALVIAASAVLFAVLMLVNYGRIVGLYEALQPGVMGAVVLTFAQLALLPNAVIWTASWIAGPGFALGTGSSVDVAQTSLGPLPTVPLLGTLPQGDPWFGLVAVLVPVLCGAGAAHLGRRRIERMSGMLSGGYPAGGWGAGRLALVVIGSAVCSGAVLGLLAWWSAGAVGPARLQHTGPDPLLVAGAVTAEVLVGGAIGIALRRQADRPATDTARQSLRERRLTGPARYVPASAGRTGNVQEATADSGWLLGAEDLPPGSADGDGNQDHDLAALLAELDRHAARGSAREASSAPRPAPARPSAPRVPAPRGRMPILRARDDFGAPEFARHEDADDDAQP